MKKNRLIPTALVVLGLATAMHFDWHAARPVEIHMSLGWRWHWLLAVPVFALTGWYVLRVWPGRLLSASLAIIGIASILAAVVEPAWELWFGGATLEWTFGRARLGSFAAFLAAGAVVHASLVILTRRRKAQTDRTVDG